MLCWRCVKSKFNSGAALTISATANFSRLGVRFRVRRCPGSAWPWRLAELRAFEGIIARLKPWTAR